MVCPVFKIYFFNFSFFLLIYYVQDFLGFLNLKFYNSWVLRKSEPFISLNAVSHSLFFFCTPFRLTLVLSLIFSCFFFSTDVGS